MRHQEAECATHCIRSNKSVPFTICLKQLPEWFSLIIIIIIRRHDEVLKETKKKTQLGQKTLKMFSSACFTWLFSQYFLFPKKYFFASNLSSSGCYHAGSFFTKEEQKRLPCDMSDTLAIHASLVYDRLLGTIWRHSQSHCHNF